MANASWAPSEPIEPQKILGSAVGDRLAGNYQTALDKHIWFHHNALKYKQTLFAVRLTLALSYWVELSKEFEPALVALEKELDDVENKLRSDAYRDRYKFHDYISINRELNKFKPVANIFEYLDTVDTYFCKEIFDLAQPFLIEAQEYELYAKYLNPKEDIERIQEEYSFGLDWVEDPLSFLGGPLGDKMKESSEKKYIENVSTMVAILVITGESQKAIEIAEISLRKMNTDELKESLKKALSGEVPKPSL